MSSTPLRPSRIPTAEVIPTILIAGTSGSGKSTLARALCDSLSGSALMLSLDHYEHLGPDCRIEDDGYIDWEHPDSRDFDRLAADISTLQSGQPTQIPTKLTFRATPPHDCTTKEYTTVSAPSILIAEGHLVLHDPRVRALGTLSIFLDTTDTDMRLNRRQHTSGDAYYDTTYFAPGEKNYVLPTREYADLIFNTDELALSALTTTVCSRIADQAVGI